MVRVTLPPGRRRYTSLRPCSHAGTLLRCRCGPGSGLLQSGCGSGGPSRRRRSCSVQTSRVPNLGAAETRPKSALQHVPPSVLMPQGPSDTSAGSLPVRLACAAAELERPFARPPECWTDPGSGSSRRAPGSGQAVAGSRTMRNSRNFPTQGSADLPDKRLGQRRSAARLLAVLVLAQVHHPDFVANAVAGEVDDDVVALGDALLVELRWR